MAFHAGLRREIEAIACMLNITIDYEPVPSGGRGTHGMVNVNPAHAARIWREHGER